LPSDPRADQKTEKPEANEKQEVNSGNGPRAASEQLLQPAHGGINEISKKYGEQKEN
jgi:hypothetical protein